MSVHDHLNDHDHPHQTQSNLKWRVGVALAGFLAIAGVLLLTEHQAHVFGVLPWLLILACPLMHMFMHGGHGGHGGHGHGDNRPGQGSTQ